MREEFILHRDRKDGEPNRRFYKVLYTAALRLGLALPEHENKIKITVDVEPYSGVRAHDGKDAFHGDMFLGGKEFNDLVLILRTSRFGNYEIVTFWPKSQDQDAYKSYTDPLVDTAMAGNPYDVKIVATVMHEKFKENAGVSPAVLMVNLYEERDFLTKQQIEEYAEKLSKSKQREQELIDLVKSSSEKLKEAEKDNAAKDKYIEELLRNALERTKILDDEMEIEEEHHLLAEKVTSIWQSKTGSDYLNCGLLADVLDVTNDGSVITLTFVDTKGNTQVIDDFGYNGLVKDVYYYLLSRKNKRAVIIITWRKGSDSIRLASDTMMLNEYNHLWKSHT